MLVLKVFVIASCMQSGLPKCMNGGPNRMHVISRSWQSRSRFTESLHRRQDLLNIDEGKMKFICVECAFVVHSNPTYPATLQRCPVALRYITAVCLPEQLPFVNPSTALSCILLL